MDNTWLFVYQIFNDTFVPNQITPHSQNKHIQKFKQMPNTITSDYWIYFIDKHQINSLNLCLTLFLLTCHFSGWCQNGWMMEMVCMCLCVECIFDASAGIFSIFYPPSLICLRIGFIYVYEHIRWICKPNNVWIMYYKLDIGVACLAGSCQSSLSSAFWLRFIATVAGQGWTFLLMTHAICQGNSIWTYWYKALKFLYRKWAVEYHRFAHRHRRYK